MNLEEYLKEYKEVTLCMIERIKSDGNIQYLVEKRQTILDAISNLDFSKDEIESIGSSLNLASLENKLNLTIKNERVDIKNKIENLKKMQNANMRYTAIGNIPSSFNKKI